MRLRSLTLAIVALAGPLVWAGTPVARAQDDQGRGNGPPVRERAQPRAEDRGHRSSMSDSVRRVRNETGGQVLSVERMQYEGREINRVKYVDDRGRVRTMDDAGSRRDADASRRQRREMTQPPRGDNPPRP